MSLIFSYESYKYLLNSLMDHGYRLTSFLNLEESVSAPQAIIRHDVDMSPKKAAKMALVEAEENVYGTYFFMLSSAWYNLLDKENEACLHEISNMGHEIGLHFDISKYEDMEEDDIQHCILRELDVLSTAISCPVKAISWHIPDERLCGKRLNFLEERWVKNAYDPKYFMEFKYLSDSNMNWREDPFDFMDKEKYPRLQILTHPVWYADQHTPKRDVIVREIGQKVISEFRYLRLIVSDSFG